MSLAPLTIVCGWAAVLQGVSQPNQASDRPYDLIPANMSIYYGVHYHMQQPRSFSIDPESAYGSHSDKRASAWISSHAAG